MRTTWCRGPTSRWAVPNHQPAQRWRTQIKADLTRVLFPRWLSGRESACQYRRRGFHPWVGKIAWRGKWQPTPVFLPGESHGKRSLGVGYSLWGHKRVGHDSVTKQQQEWQAWTRQSPGLHTHSCHTRNLKVISGMEKGEQSPPPQKAW